MIVDGGVHVIVAGTPPAGVACDTVSNGLSAGYMLTDDESLPPGVTSMRGGYKLVAPLPEKMPLSVNTVDAHVPESHIGSDGCNGRQK